MKIESWGESKKCYACEKSGKERALTRLLFFYLFHTTIHSHTDPDDDDVHDDDGVSSLPTVIGYITLTISFVSLQIAAPCTLSYVSRCKNVAQGETKFLAFSSLRSFLVNSIHRLQTFLSFSSFVSSFSFVNLQIRAVIMFIIHTSQSQCSSLLYLAEIFIDYYQVMFMHCELVNV